MDETLGLGSESMDWDELSAWLRLTLTPGVGNSAARRLLARFGAPPNIFAQTEEVLRHCVSQAQARALCQMPATWHAVCATTQTWLAGSTDTLARTMIVVGDPRYPSALLALEDPPLLVYAMGAAHLLNTAEPFASEACLAMVGSRNPTPQGAENARLFARALHAAGLTIVSGLALGVDTAAHEGALDVADPGSAQAATIAVVGTGLDRVYPAKNLDLARRIAARGVLISEYPLGTPPVAANFPKRNRIIAGLSQGTLVVEAALSSGSLITARLAAEQGREVFAIPGSIHAPQSKGCHALIRQGAKLVESAQDVWEELRLPDAPSTCAVQSAPSDAGSMPEDTGLHGSLLQALGFDPQGLDALVARTGLDTATLQVRLLELELQGRVARLPGGQFQRLGSA